MGDEMRPLFDMTAERRDQIIEDLAQKVFKHGMATPAILFLEVNKPLGRIAGNVLHLLSPGLGTLLPQVDQYGYLLQDTVNVEILIERLADLESERARQERALRQERRARAGSRKRRAQGPPDGAKPAGPGLPGPPPESADRDTPNRE